MIPVVLTPEEMRIGAEVGVRRDEEAKHLQAAFDPAGTRPAHILGARGELAFCKGIPGLVWPARVDQFKTGLPDVDPFWEIRTSRTSRLKVRWPPAPGRRLTDPPHWVVAHVTGQDDSPRFQIWGYLLASWAQANIKLTDPNDWGRPAHFVHQRELVPIEPGFHSICAWYHAPDGWLCFICGNRDY